MKKFILTLGLIAIIGTTAFAGNDKSIASMTPEQKVDYAIQSQLVVPHFLMEQPGEYTAELHFHVAPGGGLIINEIISDNAEFRANLMYQTGKITVNTEGLDTESGYKMTVRFRVVDSN